MQPNPKPPRPPRPPDVMYGSHTFERTIDEQGNEVVRDLGPKLLHPWGPKGYQEDWEPNFDVPDKRPYIYERMAIEALAERARRINSISSDIRSSTNSQKKVT